MLRNTYLLTEQKKSIELKALKNQLNPHFYLTRSIIYALTLKKKKSDDAPKVNSKLSKILDYILYRCTILAYH
jgi:sensor histidine kinase YesM